MKRFDPYHTWLGIPPGEQPPNHYRLLGISLFESDREVIRNAADQRMTYLKTYGGGQHSELSQQLLNEVSAAKVCLVNPDKKAAYDAWLQKQLAPSPADDTAADSVPSAGANEEQLEPLVTVLEGVQPWKPRKTDRPVPRNHRNNSRYLPWILLAVFLVVAALLLFLRPKNGTVRIVLSDPSAGVQVQVDGEVVAASDLKDPLELEPGEHELSVGGRGYRDHRQSFTVKSGKTVTVSVELEPVEDGSTSTPSDDTATGGKELSPEDRPPLDLAPFDMPTAQNHQRAWAKYRGTPVGKDIDLGESVSMDFILIPPGKFMMGSSEDDSDAYGDEIPQHQIEIREPFYFGIHEVTQRQFEQVMGKNPSRFTDDPGRPVEKVSWYAAKAFCEMLSAMDDIYNYRFPTEAEWEYACRAGTNTRYCFGDDANDLGRYAWFSENSDSQTHSVGAKYANAWGLYDIHGNVCEWCADSYDADYYETSPSEDPQGPSKTFDQRSSTRGGAWCFPARSCRSATRYGHISSLSLGHFGFRVVLTPAGK